MANQFSNLTNWSLHHDLNVWRVLLQSGSSPPLQSASIFCSTVAKSQTVSVSGRSSTFENFAASWRHCSKVVVWWRQRWKFDVDLVERTVVVSLAVVVVEEQNFLFVSMLSMLSIDDASQSRRKRRDSRKNFVCWKYIKIQVIKDGIWIQWGSE